MQEFKFLEPDQTISFFAGREEPFLVLKPDGTIEIGSHVKPDESARLFLDALSKQWGDLRARDNTGEGR